MPTTFNTAYGTELLPEAAEVGNPVRRALEAGIRRARAKLQRLQAQFGAHGLRANPRRFNNGAGHEIMSRVSCRGVEPFAAAGFHQTDQTTSALSRRA